jgi:hypothetical protein
VSQKRLKFFYLGGNMNEVTRNNLEKNGWKVGDAKDFVEDVLTPDYDTQKQLVIARMAQILGNKGRAEAWLATPREDFDWRTASGAIDDGEYNLVEDCIVRIEGGVY